MKNTYQLVSRRTMTLIAAIALLSAVAYATPGNGNQNGNGNGGNGKHKGWGDDSVPAAPEPAVLAMVAGGALLAGGYLTMRLRHKQDTNGSSRA